ncbi:MAG: hypothetical protein DRR06_20465 [Gammaproteobacteria bacterium]|nr:MAG: hypothetical protein DRR06_20465 [Gammaproteobacteria bacterium]
MSTELVEVKYFYNEYEAQIAKSKLEALGIDAMIVKDDAGGMNPQLQLTEGVRIFVRESDAVVASEILEETNNIDEYFPGEVD